jgi:RNA polymerase sigma factor (sigma-70 family)
VLAPARSYVGGSRFTPPTGAAMTTSYSSSATSPIGVGADLLTAAIEGQESAWVALFTRFSTALHAVARSCRLNEHDAHDVAQTTWLRLIENAHRIRSPEALGAWLAITARRECLRLIRIYARERTTDPFELPERATNTAINTPILDRERRAVLRRAIEGLPPHQRSLLEVLTADPAPSYEQIAAALQIPIGSIGPTRGRALASLRRDADLLVAVGD